MKDKANTLAVLLMLSGTCLLAAEGQQSQTRSVVEKAREAAAEGKLAYKLTTPEQMKALLGLPTGEQTEQDGGMELLNVRYTDVFARFGRMRNFSSPFTLLTLGGKAGEIDIGQNRQIVLRDTDDLSKFDPFWGLAGVSLAKLDLRGHKALLEKLPFDSRTVWPGQDRLPEGFDPIRRLKEGKTPGLGVRELHNKGIDGRGVGIGIIDQPLLRDHVEYAEQIERYEAIDVEEVPPQMHGSPVCSIAVGKNCGVAPRASLYYYAVPMWKWRGDEPYAGLLERIVEFNKTLTDRPKIRAVSISLGAFSQRPGFDAWRAAVKRASENGILVVTCDPAFLPLGTLKRNPDQDPNDPAQYTPARYSHGNALLWVPTGNRAIASHEGRDVYTYDIEGGQSWAVPYLAGLAALAFQVDPDIEPAQIVELWTATATKIGVGPIVDPPRFIEAVRSRRAAKTP